MTKASQPQMYRSGSGNRPRARTSSVMSGSGRQRAGNAGGAPANIRDVAHAERQLLGSARGSGHGIVPAEHSRTGCERNRCERERRRLLDLSGKVALVTGGSRGIGLQMAEGLGEMGARLAITARKEDELDGARAHLEAHRHRMPDDRRRSRALAEAIPGIVDAVLARWGADRRARQQRRVQLGGARRGLSGRRLAEGDEPEPRRAVLQLTREVGTPLDDPAQERQDRQHRVDRRALRQPARMGDAHRRVQRQQGRARQPDARARRRVGTAQHQRQRDLPGFFPSKMTKATLERIDRDVLDADAARPPRRRRGPEGLASSSSRRKRRVTSPDRRSPSTAG